MAEAAEALRLPVVSGNVSLYNETEGRSVLPTPVVGCVGLVEDVRAAPGRWRPGDAVLVAGAPALSLAASEYQARYGKLGGAAATIDLAAEALLVAFLWRAAGLLTLAHDASEGGLAVCLAEASIWSGFGVDADLGDDPVALFGEGGGQAVIACAPGDVGRLGGVPLKQIGVVGGDRVLGSPLRELAAAWRS
jgi:phosphoribosylformylglycinamidine synthase